MAADLPGKYPLYTFAFSKTTASDPDSAQASLAPHFVCDNLRVLCVYVLRASGERIESEAESKAEAADWKRAIILSMQAILRIMYLPGRSAVT